MGLEPLCRITGLVHRLFTFKEIKDVRAALWMTTYSIEPSTGLWVIHKHPEEMDLAIRHAFTESHILNLGILQSVKQTKPPKNQNS